MGPREFTPNAAILDSVMADNASDGLLVGRSTSPATVTLADSIETENGVGVNIGPGSSVGSYGDNEINGNGTDIQAFFPGAFALVAKK